jgi:hypothetical protein
MTPRIMSFSIMTLSIETANITAQHNDTQNNAFSIITLSIKTPNITVKHNDNQHFDAKHIDTRCIDVQHNSTTQ